MKEYSANMPVIISCVNYIQETFFEFLSDQKNFYPHPAVWELGEYDRIQELTALELDNDDIRLHVFLSLHLMFRTEQAK